MPPDTCALADVDPDALAAFHRSLAAFRAETSGPVRQQLASIRAQLTTGRRTRRVLTSAGIDPADLEAMFSGIDSYLAAALEVANTCDALLRGEDIEAPGPDLRVIDGGAGSALGPSGGMLD